MKLHATRITLCRHLILKQVVDTLGPAIDQITTYEEGTNNLLGWIKIDVPETRDFCGAYCRSAEEAIEPVSLATLFYM